MRRLNPKRPGEASGARLDREVLYGHYPECPEEIRELTYGQQKHKNKCRILFSIHEETVTILYVHHSARKELEP